MTTKTPQEMLTLLGDLGYGGTAWAYEAAEILRAVMKENSSLHEQLRQQAVPQTFRERVREVARVAPTVDPRCPRCRGEMVLRTNRADGTRFWGCQQYPKCRGTVDSYVGGTMRREGYDAQVTENWSSDHNLDEDEEELM